MKNIIQILVVVFFTGILFTSCKQEDPPKFSEKSLVYFYWNPYNKEISRWIGKIHDSTEVSFRISKNTDSIIKIPIAVQGNPSNKDQEVTISVVKDKTTAIQNEDFTFLSSKIVVPADSLITYLPLKLIKQPKMETNKFSIVLKLEPNDYFKTDLIRSSNQQSKDSTKIQFRNNVYNVFKVNVTSILIKPKNWPSQKLGGFSIKKINLISTITKISLEDIYTNLNTENQSNFQFARVEYFGRELKRYLQKKNFEGNPVLEKDGTPMEVGPFA